jgi:hypothetical protein
MRYLVTDGVTVIIPSRIRDTELAASVTFTSNTYLPARRFAVLAALMVKTSSPFAVLENAQTMLADILDE